MKNKMLWKILLILGFLPFLAAIIIGIYFAITGFSGLCFCPSYYGFDAFVDSIILISYLIYPLYIIGILLIILSIIKLKKKTIKK